MTSTLRPRTTVKQTRSNIKLSTSNRIHCKLVSPTDTHADDMLAAPSWSQSRNPCLDRFSMNWADIQESDRSVYLLQKGAPLDGDISPEGWSHDAIKKILFDGGISSLDELSSRYHIERLKSRYESIRLGLERFFNSKPEPVHRSCWTLRKIEGFDAYDTKSSSKKCHTRQKNSVLDRSKSDNSSTVIDSTNKMEENVRAGQNRHATDKILEVDAERTMIVDLEDDGEDGVVTEAEDI